ncbi:MAG: ribokinase, partial [Clostridia bacterium]|nr:ribokinase [Clostridia bacterium]
MDLVIQSPVEVKQGQTVMGHGFMTNGGGKGANQAAAAGKLGAKDLVGGAFGTDAFGQIQPDTPGAGRRAVLRRNRGNLLRCH